MDIREELEQKLRERGAGDLSAAADQELYHALLELVAQRLEHAPRIQGDKKLYYGSAEFLVGKLLSNNLINLGLYAPVKEALAQAGRSLAALEELEAEPSLGNGGLGRLAACYMDSTATLGLPADGVGLLYHFGLFHQKFWDYKQQEEPDVWLSPACPWVRKTDITFAVPFPQGEVRSRLYEVDVTGYGGKVNRLRLFDLETVDESLVKEGIDFDKKDIAHNLTLFLYPDDSDRAGRLLRVYQQYFMVSNAAQLILKELAQKGYATRDLHKHAVIQINDTHPSMIIPELIRLMQLEGISMDEAISIVSQCCAYTNHTILAEALEKWPLDYLEEAVPQLVPILRELDRRVKEQHPDPAVAILDENDLVHMAHLDIHYGFSVNGVASLHTEILEKSELKAFAQLYPEKFNNKTNGITFRRWLLHCNPELSQWITGKIGPGWKKDAAQLEGLLAYQNDAAALEELLYIKQEKKRALCKALQQREGVALEEDSIFDIQIKRLHEYKRQQMNALYIIWKYRQIKAGHRPTRPITLLFGAKAAPAYTNAKDIIHLILCLQDLIGQRHRQHEVHAQRRGDPGHAGRRQRGDPRPGGGGERVHLRPAQREGDGAVRHGRLPPRGHLRRGRGNHPAGGLYHQPHADAPGRPGEPGPPVQGHVPQGLVHGAAGREGLHPDQGARPGGLRGPRRLGQEDAGEYRQSGVFLLGPLRGGV